MSLSLFERWSPEYALSCAFEDMNEKGLEGLKRHLTEKALKTVEGFESLSSNTGIDMITNALVGGNAVSTLLEKLNECDWTIEDVMKGKETSKAIVGFSCEDVMTGTIEMELIKEEKIWKIDDLKLPKFESFNLPKEKED